ncbi:ABC transporter ATP-binding protein [Gluconobacter morbifer]|uniref:ABC transporter ATP-binding protein n=1 Tax=Gluconobacter morbifer G707 TaxID=1088869 RepID=G6XJ08_9PROT|nr:ABC transporter ATP-binding protein [Gluconobacter morbifer]EHH68124.1 ABC transporter ATP-binding protein [Gluconobacter morbifer G707]
MVALQDVSRLRQGRGSSGQSIPVLRIERLQTQSRQSPFGLLLPAGQRLTLFGDNSAALSHILDVIAGFAPRLDGRISVNGKNVSTLPPGQRGIAVVSPRDPLFSHLDVRQNIAFPLRASGRSATEATATAGRMLSLLGLDGAAGKSPRDLTAEETLRAQLARALVGGPTVLLLDDPLSGLDAPAARRTTSLLTTLTRALELSIVHAVSRRDDALQSGGQIAVFQDQVLLQCADAARLYDRPASIEVATLFGEANALTGQVLDIADDVARVHLACGGIVEAMAEGVQDGEACLVCVRPDRISPFFGAQGLSVDDGDVPVRGTLANSAHLGDHVRLKVRCPNGTEIELWRPPLQAQKIPRNGTPVELAWPPSHATAFPLRADLY